jgi:chemotaxis protein CheX
MQTRTLDSSPHASTANLVVHFVASVRAVFTTMLATTVNVGTPCSKNDPAPSYDVSAIIGFSGNATGSMVVSFTRETAAAVASAFTGAELEHDSVDFADAIGELANMIAGGAKKNFGTLANISVPTVILGTGHSVARLHDVPCIVVPCSTKFGRFAIEVSLKSLQSTK